MENSTAVIITLGLLCIMLLALTYRYLPRLCRRKGMNLQGAQGGARPGGGETHTATQVARATPQLCAYNRRRFLASFPSLDRLLSHTISWQEGVTLESGLMNASARNDSRLSTQEGQQPGQTQAEAQPQTQAKPQAKAEAQAEESNNNDKANKGQHPPGCDPGTIPQPCGPSAGTQTSRVKGHSSTGILAHSILNMVSSIPNVSLGAFTQSQSLPNVHGCLAESVSTPSGSRDLVVLWSTTLESTDNGILTSTRIE